MFLCCKKSQKINESGRTSKSALVETVKDPIKVKLLLLGAGESGKSTLFKQINQIYGNPVKAEDLNMWKHVIFSNIIDAMKVLCIAVEMLGFLDQLQQTHSFEQLIAIDRTVELTHVIDSSTVGDMIRSLWSDPAIRKAWECRQQLQIVQSHEVFLNEIDRIARKNYIPTESDIILARVRTSGISTRELRISNKIISLVDVGGQRDERRKWVHVLDEEVKCIIYVAAISEYDQVLYENARQNRIFESLAVFSEICNMPVFKDTAIMLFLNKRDLFEQKIKISELSKTFPEYTGGSDYEAAVQFIKEKFLLLNHNPKKEIFVHVTCATDTGNMKFVLEAVEQIILNQNLTDSGIL
eukprot:c13555_g1_i1.p1 GENE.c13555_g1_i1~~c13555_g1_i1.p1  ORF type:complete len:363 (+),score=104.12 c13555_g1_i1:28-1089(+)